MGVSRELVLPLTRSIATLGYLAENTLNLSNKGLVSLENLCISDIIIHSQADETTNISVRCLTDLGETSIEPSSKTYYQVSQAIYLSSL